MSQYAVMLRPWFSPGGNRMCMAYSRKEERWVQIPDYEGLDMGKRVKGVEIVNLMPGHTTSPAELARILSGLEGVYDAICAYTLASGSKIEQWVRYTKAETSTQERFPTPGEISQGDSLPIPILRRAADRKVAAWDGRCWGTVPYDRPTANYAKIGSCFGWDVLFNDNMYTLNSVEYSLVNILAHLIKTFAPLHTDSRLYTYSLKYQSNGG